MSAFRSAAARIVVIVVPGLTACQPARLSSNGAMAGEVHARTFLDRPELGAVLFHPSPQERRDLPPGVRAVTMTTADGTQLAGRLSVASPSAPLILWFYGNGERAEHYDALAERFAALTWSLLLFDYRGYGASQGKPSATALLRDAAELGARLRGVLADLGVTPSRLVVVGRSLGSAPAIELAARAGKDIDGLVLDSAFADTLRLVRTLGFAGSLAARVETADGFDNVGRLRCVQAPVLVVHGELDRIVPIEEARALAAVVPSSTLLAITDAGHNDLLQRGYEAYVAALREMLER